MSATQKPNGMPPLQKFGRLMHKMQSNESVLEELQAYLMSESSNITEGKGATVYFPNESFPIDERAAALRRRVEEDVKRSEAEKAALLADIQQQSKQGSLTWLAGSPEGADEKPSAHLTTIWRIDSNSWIGTYELVTLRSAATVAESFCTQMRYLASVGDAKSLTAAYDGGVSDLQGSYGPNDCRRVFGSLELMRHLLCFSVQSPKSLDSLSRFSYTIANFMGAASKCIETLERDINDLAAKSLSTTAYRTFKIACGQVLIEYATFFNLFLAFQSALSGELGSFVDSLSPYNSSYLGFTRFPSLSRTCTAQKEETDVGELQGLNPCNEVSYNYFRLFGMKENEFVFPSATGRSLSCIPKIVSAVLMPSDSFAALHIIAAIASKPLQEALFLIRSLPELQTLYASSPLLAPLLSAVEKGDFKKALQAGNEIQSQLLAKEYFLGEEFVTNLMERFKCSVCFSFFVVYENIPIAKGCEALGLSEAEVLAIVKKLISLGVLGARIDLVDHCLFQEDPVKNDSAVVNMISSTYATVRNLETNVRLLEIERSFEIPSFKALEARGQKGGKVR